jgi:TonB-dependent receptor
MKLKVKLLTGAAIVAGAVAVVPANAQTTQDQTTQNIETVVVTGLRASLDVAMDIKRNSGEIEDSIVATDIGKMPDQTVADALQRVTGIQIMRDLGEGGAGQNAGSGIAIRGLSEVEMTIDGQEVLTASGVRTYNLEDIPSELVAGVDVYKTSAADLLEGGLGGLIDIRMRKPFDFEGMELAANVSLDYADLIDTARPSASVLFSDRWNTSVGEMGFLVDFSYQDRALAQDYASAGAPGANTTAIPGHTIETPNGVYEPMVRGTRPRVGLSAAFQWRPSSTLEFYAEANDSRLSTYQNQPTFEASYGGVSYPVSGSYTLFPGTNFMEKGSFGPLPLGSALGFTSIMGARDSTEYNQDYTIGGKWNPSDEFTLTGSINWQRSTYLLNVAYGYLYAGGETLVEDFSGTAPSNIFTGPDLTQLSNYNDNVSNTLAQVQQWYTAQNTAGKLDAVWTHNFGPFNEFDFGIRYSDHESVFNQTPYYYTKAPNSNPTTYQSDLMLVDTHNFEGVAAQTEKFWVFNPNVMHATLADVGSLFGNIYTKAFAPLNLYTMDERVFDGYAEAKVNLGSLDGNFGVRIINTNRSAAGTETNNATSPPTYTPVTYHGNHTDILPSMNLRFHLTDELQLRLAASRTTTRPNFSSMNPNTTLNPGSLSGSEGNINLPAMYSSNIDLSLEEYFSKTGSVYIAGFTKSVHNFPFSTTFQEVIGGLTYTVSEQGASSVGGNIKGFEAGYTQFYDFLPGIWKGLGLQANFTYIDSTQPYYIGSALAATTSLQNLSKYSYNVIGMYELDPVSIRVAYTWRSSFLNSLYTGLGGGVGDVPIKQAGFGWLDASLTYNINEHFSAYLQGQNLLNTMQYTYYQYTYAPANYYLNDRQFILGVRYKM